MNGERANAGRLRVKALLRAILGDSDCPRIASSDGNRIRDSVGLLPWPRNGTCDLAGAIVCDLEPRGLPAGNGDRDIRLGCRGGIACGGVRARRPLGGRRSGWR